jgi:hypothetical protein
LPSPQGASSSLRKALAELDVGQHVGQGLRIDQRLVLWRLALDEKILRPAPADRLGGSGLGPAESHALVRFRSKSPLALPKPG